MEKKRSRIISIRLSDQEYESLKKLSRSKGSRSISEFTRSVACRPVSNDADSKDAAKLDNALENLNRVVKALEQHLKQLDLVIARPDKKEDKKEDKKKADENCG